MHEFASVEHVVSGHGEEGRVCSRRSATVQQGSVAVSYSSALVQLCGIARSADGLCDLRWQWRDLLPPGGSVSGGDVAQQWHPLLTRRTCVALTPVIIHLEACPNLSEHCIVGLPCRCENQDFVVIDVGSLQTTQCLLDPMR